VLSCNQAHRTCLKWLVPSPVGGHRCVLKNVYYLLENVYYTCCLTTFLLRVAPACGQLPEVAFARARLRAPLRAAVVCEKSRAAAAAAAAAAAEKKTAEKKTAEKKNWGAAVWNCTVFGRFACYFRPFGTVLVPKRMRGA
jgi:hypothetical protein